MHRQQQQRQPVLEYRNACITLHQPWASLLVHGIKRVEGRSWPAPINILSGRLWIHAAGKVPEASTIEAMEKFYREVYNVDGVADIKFPDNYPVSVLLGSVKVVGCLKQEELVSWEDLPQGVRLEGLTDFCWLCEDPQRLVVPFEMRGWQGVYNLEKRIAADAIRALRPVQGPAPVKFPLPDPADPRSLRPGALQAVLSQEASKVSKLASTPSLDASIADARTAANQFRKKELYECSRPRPSPGNTRGPHPENQSVTFESRKESTMTSQSRDTVTKSRGSSSTYQRGGR